MKKVDSPQPGARRARGRGAFASQADAAVPVNPIPDLPADFIKEPLIK